MENNKLQVDIEASWAAILEDEFRKPYFNQLVDYLRNEKKKHKIVYPKGSLIFHAFNSTPFDQVRVVILGQDPYHGPGQAMGLSFSVPRGIRNPPSLANIYKELNRSTSFTIPGHGDLTSWSGRGVFMLNAILTVESGNAGSHSRIGWETFTDGVIQKLSDKRSGLVFMLWGNFARSKKELIDGSKHLILESRHPSPLAGNTFLGNNHFADANTYFIKNGQKPLNWQL